ncbi:DUF3073 domain-containing protein [Corynebacterium uterequi]|uniref:Putative DUF3073 family protein n=1 Tax=Corynebacterium uterequi TaxID=1072256 RepID=A0A0G3HIP5_9CORY|nr:DUF3073 domain-containing protein [Corynebacterium uterequi]AKK11813.1 putative DUF3073 family protein [Corynebacterium uterequi]
MGRGRAKAKQTKVARQLKYNSPEMDLDSLQRELSGQKPNHSSARQDSTYDDEYAEYVSRYSNYDEWDD